MGRGAWRRPIGLFFHAPVGYRCRTSQSAFLVHLSCNSDLHKLIQQNDIVFIRYERLDAEDNFGLDGFDTEIMKSNLPGKVYDMMGLVDLSSETYSSDANVSIVNVSGRDFTKMITEDSSVFFPFALVNGGKDFFLAYDPKHTVFKRMFVGEQFSYQAMKLYRSIRDSVGFIFNQLTNVGVLPRTATCSPRTRTRTTGRRRNTRTGPARRTRWTGPRRSTCRRSSRTACGR